jgi:hypothetical protein
MKNQLLQRRWWQLSVNSDGNGEWIEREREYMREREAQTQKIVYDFILFYFFKKKETILQGLKKFFLVKRKKCFLFNHDFQLYKTPRNKENVF